MKALGNRSLLARIVVVIAIILLLFYVLSVVISYRQQRAFIIEEAVEKARIIAAAAIRTRDYLSNELLAGQVPLSRERYGLIPVVASNRIGEQVGQDLGYRVRQVSERYRNARNAPDAFEQQVLQMFYGDSQAREYHAIDRMAGEPVFRYLRAFVADRSCLECHGDPAHAPDFLKELFPVEEDQAYGYRLGEVIGAASVTIPMASLRQQLEASLRFELLTAGGIFLALILFLGLLTRYSVVRPLERIALVIGEIVRTGRFEQKLPERGKDEIGRLVIAFNEMIDHMRESTSHLEESERRFRILTDTAYDGIISFLANGQIILFNRQAERMFGYSKVEALGMTIDRLIHPDCRSLHEQGIESYLRQEEERLVGRITRISGRRRDGNPLVLDLSLAVAQSDGHSFYTAIVRQVEVSGQGAN
jgi:PAS domain S-box-containing protein